jgi:phage terminase small subunit
MTTRRSDPKVVPLPSQRLRPPPHLTPAEKEVFVAIVGAVEPRHFHPSDLPLMASYAVSIVQEQEAARRLQAEGYIVNGRPSPWIVIQEKAHRQMIALTLRLRLSPQGRGNRNRKVEPDSISVYERMELEEDGDGDED